MELKIFAIKDNKIATYHQPFFCPNETLAIRAVAQSMASPNMQISHFAEDFDLYEIGSYDDQLGKIVPIDAHFITNLKTVKLSEEKRLSNGNS